MNKSKALRVLRAWLDLDQKSFGKIVELSGAQISRLETRPELPINPKALERLNEKYGAMLGSMSLKIEDFLNTGPEDGEASE